MVDYEHGDDEPQHAVLSWLDDEASELPEVGTQLVRLTDYEALKTGPASYAGVTRMLGEVQQERDDLRSRALAAETALADAREALREIEDQMPGSQDLDLEHWKSGAQGALAIARAALGDTGNTPPAPALDRISFESGYITAGSAFLHGVVTPGDDGALKTFAERAWKATGGPVPPTSEKR